MAVLKCKMCGGDLVIEPGMTVCECEYCGSKQTLPKLDDDKKANLYDRANHFRRNNEFDKAMAIYEEILKEDNTDAESYWSIVLCRYGIEYVEDGASHKRIPTVNRAQLTSIFADEDYKAAIKYADAFQKEIYTQEAKTIDEIQKGILEISNKEEPFDVFICYKETDSAGRRTRDSVLANDLYNQLTQEGYKVFFSRITLEDKLGTAYEPYIFAALNSAKVMVVVGTKPEFFNAVWVKNEWSRYLALIKGGAKKTLIPAYRDMDPYDLPEEFSHLQAQDMGKLGFMQDLLRGIKKIIGADSPKAEVKETVVINNAADAGIENLLKRVFMFLEDGDWKSADEYCEKILDVDSENARAYLGKLMAELQVKKQEKLAECENPFDDKNNYKKVLRFADEKLASELRGYVTHIKERNEAARLAGIYNSAVRIMRSAKAESDYKSAAKEFKSIPGYKDSDALAKECLEKAEVAKKEAEAAKKEAEAKAKAKAEAARKEAEAKAEAARKEDEAIAEAVRKKAEAERIAKENKRKRIKKITTISAAAAAVLLAFVIVLDNVILPPIRYKKANEYMANGQYSEAVSLLMKAGNYKDSEELIKPYRNKFDSVISAGYNHTVGLKANGTVVATGSNEFGQCNVYSWTDIVAVSAGDFHTVGLKADGTVVAVGNNRDGRCDVDSWSDIVAISAASDHTVGLKADGTVVAVGHDSKDGECDVRSWTDIVAISAGGIVTMGLKSDGTVVAVGYNDGRCNVGSWSNIVAISAGTNHTVGLKANGKVVTAGGGNIDGRRNVWLWSDIVAIDADDCTVGLKANGKVVAAGSNKQGQRNVRLWSDIVAVANGDEHTVGLKADGTVVATGNNENGQCNVSSWQLLN